MPNIAVLIDAENIDPVFASQIFERAETLGTVVVREIYGAGIALNEWYTPILKYAIHMNMTLKPNRFKNSSDIALVISAMELLTARLLAERVPGGSPEPVVDTVIIASADSDFSLLSVRLRTAGFKVIGMGDTTKINQTWPAACTEFIPLIPPKEDAQERQTQAMPKPASNMGAQAPNDKPTQWEQPENNVPVQTASVARTNAPSYARSHEKRAERIRALISSQLAENDGKLQASSLFDVLKKNPDYRYDQQRSKRNPLDYLARQYPETLRIGKGENGGIWIYSVSFEAQSSATPAIHSDSCMAEKESDSTAEQSGIAGPSAEASIYEAVGISKDIAARIETIFDESPNRFAAFNKLRSEFGADKGRKYYQLVKEHRQGGRVVSQPSSAEC